MPSILTRDLCAWLRVLGRRALMPFGVFVAFYDFFLGHLFKAVLGFDALEEFDGLSTLNMSAFGGKADIDQPLVTNLERVVDNQGRPARVPK